LRTHSMNKGVKEKIARFGKSSRVAQR